LLEVSRDGKTDEVFVWKVEAFVEEFDGNLWKCLKESSFIHLKLEKGRFFKHFLNLLSFSLLVVISKAVAVIEIIRIDRKNPLENQF
jgi:hypothetical protein